jgi:hypothetical protein
MIKDELEWTAEYFNRYDFEPGGVTKNADVRDYNYDMWSGIEYRLDVTKPVGQRVVELKLNGQPLAMDKLVRVALNNYRATGKFPTAKRLYQSTIEVRELITEWIADRGTIAPGDVFVKNWALVPPANVWLYPTTEISRTDFADLLWAGFDRSREAYLVPLPNEKKPGPIVPRQGGLYLLCEIAMDGLWDIQVDYSVLDAYKDRDKLFEWAREPVALALQANIFSPAGDKILPRQPATNGEALAWLREAR